MRACFLGSWGSSDDETSLPGGTINGSRYLVRFVRLQRAETPLSSCRLNVGGGKPSPNETNSQRKQSGSEGSQDHLCSMPARSFIRPVLSDVPSSGNASTRRTERRGPCPGSPGPPDPSCSVRPVAPC